MAIAGRFTRMAKACLPPTRNASALALSGTIWCGRMVPPNSWMAAYLLSAAMLTQTPPDVSSMVVAMARASATTIDDTSGGVCVSIAADSKYAAIHEFGGTILPHQIVPDKAKALAFLVGGKQAFAMRVNLPAIAMAERSYLRSSLAEMADEIKAGLSEAIAESLS